jgi:arylsulfatase A-like enzyme
MSTRRPLALLVPAFLWGACTSEKPETDRPVYDDTDVDSDDTVDSETAHSDDTDSGHTGETGDTGFPEVGELDLPDLGRKNILYIHVDTLRQDHLPFYGYDRDTLPSLHDHDWLVIDGLHGSAGWTIPSTASVLTGLDPERHGAIFLAPDKSEDYLEMEADTLTETLLAEGFWTASMSGNPWVSSMSDLTKGFESRRYIAKGIVEPNSQEIVDQALSWIDTAPEGDPFFLFLQPMDPHDPYWVDPAFRDVWLPEEQVPFDLDGTVEEQIGQIFAAFDQDEEFATYALNAVYDEQLLGLDRSLATLLDGLAERGRLDDTLVILSGDHGETLNDGEDRLWGHGGTLRQELIRVPLLILNPTIPGGEVRCLSENVDVLPTVLDIFGMTAPAGLDGQSMRDSCRPYAAANQFTGPSLFGMVAITDDRFKYAWLCKEHIETVYDLVADPHELSPIPPDDFPDIGLLRKTMQAEVDEVIEALPDMSCELD